MSEIELLNNKVKEVEDKLNAHWDHFHKELKGMKVAFDKLEKTVEHVYKQSELLISQTTKYTNSSIDELEKNWKTKIKKIASEEVKNLTQDSFSNFTKVITSRLEILENYIKKQKFHDVLEALEKLEEEFQTKAIEVMNTVIMKNKSKKRDRNV